MNRHKLFFIILLFSILSFAGSAFADESQPRIETPPVSVSTDMKFFHYLTVNNGFTRNSVFDILQDEKGLMWFSLWDGLYRYDGNKLYHIEETNFQAQHVKRSILTLISNGKGEIWIGTSNGISIWDAVHEKLIEFDAKTAEGDSISGQIDRLYRDAYDNIWIINEDKQLFIYSVKQKKLKSMNRALKTQPYKLKDIYMDHHQNILLSTLASGVFKLDGNKKGQDPFDCKHWGIKDFPLLKYFKTRYVGKMYQDSHDNYWLATTHAIFQIVPQKGQPPLISKFTKNSDDSQHIKITAFKEYNCTLYATTNQGLFSYNLHTDSAVWNLPDYTEENSLNDKSLTNICIDRENGMWISSFYGGVNYMHPTNKNFAKFIDLNKSIQGHVISGITEDRKGNIWMAVEDNGICLWNRKNNTIESFNDNTNTPYRPKFHNVQSIYADGDQLYVGMHQGGLDIVNLNTFAHINLNIKNTHPNPLPNHIYAFHKISDRQMLLGTISGLYNLDTQTLETRQIKDINGKVNCIKEDETGDLWVSTLTKGFYWYSKTTSSWKQFVQSPKDSTHNIGNSITTIFPLNPSIFIGTQGNGLWIFDKDTQTSQEVAPKTFKDCIIFNILHKGELLWITTNKGLFAYNITNQQTKQYTIQDGLRSNQFKENSGIVTSDNAIVIGGLNGFNFFKPKNLKNNNVLPQVILTDFYLFNKSADIHDKDCPLKQSITYTDQVDLNQKHHSFAFKFSSTSYCDPKKNKFEYKLEPFETEWQHGHDESNMASYTNLPAGEYIFHVRTSNGEGVWSEEKCVKVNIHPYWWLTLPMKTFYLLLLAAIIAHFILRYRNKKREEIHLFRMEKDKEVYESKMKFFTCMVHEIRTPLTLILGPLNSAMKKEKTVKEVLPDLQIIERNGKRLLSLVNQLMDFRKVEDKSYSVQMTLVNIKELILQTAKDFRYYNVQKKVSFDFDIPEEECWATLDREAFTKVLGNLLSNAMKFTKDHIQVKLSRTADGKYWETSVQDNGKGIPIEDQDSIFDSFYQVHQDLPGDYVGTGIGLFVVRRLQRLQKGDIRVDSETNQGANFIATNLFAEAPVKKELPMIPDNKIEAKAQEEQFSAQTVNYKRRRLLIAEDNEEMRNYICSLFSEKYDIDAFENGKKALDATKMQSYDLVITDLMMPIMDGMALCRTLKGNADTCHIPIIILTAKDDETSQMEGFESEADMYVTKPFSADVLLSRVKSILRNREHLRQKFYSEPETTAEMLYTNESDKEFLEKLDDLISQRLAECNLPIDDLAAEMAMGRSAFYQKVKGVTGLTPNDYIRTFRLKKAVTFFQKGETRINEVCYRVGFSSPSYFTKRFTLQFGISPSDYLKRNNFKMEK